MNALRRFVHQVTPARVACEPQREPGCFVVSAIDQPGESATIYWDTSDPLRVGWSYRCGEDSGALVDAEDLAWLLCDVLGVARPKRANLQALADEAGAAGDRLQVAACHAAMEGDPAAILSCALVMTDAATRAAS